MAQFKDVKGRVWEFRLTARMVDDCEAQTQENFFAEMAARRIPVRLAWRLAYFAVREQAEKVGLKTYEAWLDGIGKRAVGEMTAAVMTEIAEFFPEAEAEEKARPPAAGHGKTSTS